MATERRTLSWTTQGTTRATQPTTTPGTRVMDWVTRAPSQQWIIRTRTCRRGRSPQVVARSSPVLPWLIQSRIATADPSAEPGRWLPHRCTP